MRIPVLILCGALAVPLTAVAQNNSQNSQSPTAKTTQDSGNTTQSDMMGPKQQPQLSVEAQHFLTVLAAEDKSEIDLAQLALKKSNNPQVKQYAKTKILAADPAMRRGAQRVAKQAHVTVPGLPSSGGGSEFYYLSKLNGKAFDKAYMSYEDAKQNEDLIMVQNEIKAAKNPKVKNYVQAQEKPVQEAAQAAKEIAEGLG